MTYNIRKYLEYSFFIFINFCFTSIGAALILRLTGILSTNIIIILHHVNPIVSDTNRDLNLYLGIIGLSFLYLIIKPTIFLILYKLKKQLPYIHSFFNKFRTDPKFMYKVLVIPIFFDAICCLLYREIKFCIFLSLVFNYLIFLLFFHPVKEDKISEDGTIIQSKIANIITNIFIFINILLIAFISALTTLIFIF